MTSPGVDKPLIFDWGDGSPTTPAAYTETVSHQYAGPGTYLIVVREAVSGEIAYTSYAYVVSDDPVVLTVADTTVYTCQPSPFTASLTNGFAEVQQVFSYSKLKGTSLTASNVLWERDDGSGNRQVIPMTNMPDGSIQAIGGPFTVERESDMTVTLYVRLPSTATGTVTGHVDYVTSTVEDEETLDRTLNILASDDFVLTVAAGDCSSPPSPGTCSISGIVPDVNEEITDDDGNVTGTGPLDISTGQAVQVTGLGLANVVAMIAITDASDGFPLQFVTYSEADDPDNPGSTLQFVNGVIGLLPCVDEAHIHSILVQDALNTTRCAITVDWNYTPGPVPELALDPLGDET